MENEPRSEQQTSTVYINMLDRVKGDVLKYNYTTYCIHLIYIYIECHSTSMTHNIIFLYSYTLSISLSIYKDTGLYFNHNTNTTANTTANTNTNSND